MVIFFIIEPFEELDIDAQPAVVGSYPPLLGIFARWLPYAVQVTEEVLHYDLLEGLMLQVSSARSVP